MSSKLVLNDVILTIMLINYYVWSDKSFTRMWTLDPSPKGQAIPGPGYVVDFVINCPIYSVKYNNKDTFIQLRSSTHYYSPISSKHIIPLLTVSANWNHFMHMDSFISTWHKFLYDKKTSYRFYSLPRDLQVQKLCWVSILPVHFGFGTKFSGLIHISSNLLILRWLLPKTKAIITLARIAECSWIVCWWQWILKLIGWQSCEQDANAFD